MKSKLKYILCIGVSVLIIFVGGTLFCKSKYEIDVQKKQNKIIETVYEDAVFDNAWSREEWKGKINGLKPVEETFLNKSIDKYDFDNTLKKANKHLNSLNNKMPEELPKVKTKKIYRDFKIIEFGTFSVKDDKDGNEKFENYVKIVHDEIMNKDNKGLILDYRNDSGGQFEAHLLSVAPLIKNDKDLLYGLADDNTEKFNVLISSKKNKTFVKLPKEYSNESFYIKKDLSNYKRDNLKIAVLMSNATASSAEMTILALKQNKNVRIFGSDSAGYTSFNSKSGYINLTDAWIKDINNTIYRNDPIKPDVKGASPEEIIKWLND